MIVSLKNKERVFKLSSLGLMFVLVTACTKEIPYKYKYKDKEEITNKSLIDENAEYLMVSSTGATSRTSEDRPFWMGETRIVKLKFEETELQVIEMEQDARFKDNATNNKVVMSIPVTHHQFQCAKDRNGQCTNQEEDADISWKEKTIFKPDFANTSVKAADSSTVEFDKLFGEGCYSEIGSKTLGYELEQDGLNIQLEKTYRINVNCISDIESWDELFTKTISSSIVHHSIVKLDSLTSADYKVRKYTQNDSNVFGFFDQTTKTLDVDLRPTLGTESMLMSMWNPNRSIVEYHLSDEFAKPENKALKDATFKAFDALNDGLTKAGAKFRMKLNEPSGKQPGDIRYSMIVMVEDPIASGLLGYGPSVKNPRTGEIVSARTVMYPGVMHQQVMQTYNEIYHQKMEAQKSVKTLEAQLTVNPLLLAKALTVKPAENSTDSAPLAVAASKAKVKVPRAKLSQSDLISGKVPQNLEKQIRSQKNVVRFSSAEIRQIQETDSIEMALDQKMKKELFKSRHCFYPAEMLAADSEMALNVEAALGEVTKPWHELSESEKKTVIAVILPQAWTQTLIHEVGHNLGLRHNFQGSEDAANFYTDQELASMGVKTKIPYSSVMDYGASSQSELPVLGKYDIAALRFAYASQVEVVDANGQVSLVNVPTTIDDLKKTLGKSSLKDYGFCTDDHADANAGCNRFDQGTNNVEMVEHMISEYKKRQFYLNRLDRRNFSMGNDHLYASGTSYRFFHIRAFIESYERMKEVLLQYNLDIEDPAVLAEYAFIKDIRDAAIIAGQFFIDVLQTPNTTCAIAMAAKPNQIMAVMPLSDLDDSALSCYEASLNPAYKVVAEAGKSFNSKKSTSSDNPYADQIDLRGIWSDKVIASKYILNRKLNHSSYDQRVDNVTDMPTLTQSVFDVYAAISTNTLVANAEFETPAGQKLMIPVQANLQSHFIKAPLYWFTARIIGVPNRESYLQETISNHLVQAMVNSPLKINQSNVEYMDAFKVATMSTGTKEDLLDSGVEFINFGSTRYIATPQNVVAKELILSANNSELLTRLGEEKVTELLKMKMDGQQIDITASVDEKKAFNLDNQILTDFLQGSLPTVDSSMTLLKLLPN